LLSFNEAAGASGERLPAQTAAAFWKEYDAGKK